MRCTRRRIRRTAGARSRRAPGARGATITAALLLAAAAPLAAQDVAIEPTLLWDDSGAVPALRLAVEHASAGRDTEGAFPREWSWALEADAPLAWDSDRNPERLTGEARLGMQMSLYRPPDPTDISVDAPPARDYGYVSFQARVALEAPQSADLVDVGLGGSVGYEHDRYETLWFLPEAKVDIGLVACAFSCDFPLSGGAVETRHVRLDADVRWNLMLDRRWMPAVGKPLWLRLRGRAFQAWGMPEPLMTLREEEGRWGSIEVAYEIDPVDWLDEVHVRWTGGEIPVRLGDRRAWMFGVTVIL